MKTKFAIGCLVQWYEIDMVGEYIDSLKDALNHYNDDELLIDFTFNINQMLERVDESQTSIETIVNKFTDMMGDLESDNNYNVKYRINEDFIMIADYRRWFLDRYCTEVDLLVQGESDALIPKQTFTILDYLHNSVKDTTPKYLATFGINKMWDDSWKPLEHVEFTDKPRDPYAWWGTRSVMSKEKMNEFNDKVEDLNVVTISPHKFNGCGVVFSSEAVKSGVNIPKGAFFIDDTALNMMSNKVLGNMPQYHFRNILIVHNREHENKRNYVLGEEGNDLTAKRKSNDWYVVANEYSKFNDANIFNPNTKFFTWKDVLEKIKEV